MTQMTVNYIDHMGNDYSPIRAAIVSNGANNSEKYIDDELRYKKAATSLIQFLARGCTTGEWNSHVSALEGEVDLFVIEDALNYMRHMPPHWTPFGHSAITIHCKAPIFVARQLGKHQVGFVWNEISRRYVDNTPEFYSPSIWRGRAEDVKQGSSSEAVTNSEYWDANAYVDEMVGVDINKNSLDTYKHMLEIGVAPEQARMVLPQSTMTEWYWTGNLYGFSKMFMARTDPHTQKETRDVAHMIGDVIRPLFPISWAALTTGETE